MADMKQSYYFVDPGIGEKSENCPYSLFEDGRDVSGYIIAPEGYEFTEFKFEPYDGTEKYYNGKIVAQFEKLSKMDVLMPVLWKYIVAGVAAIGVVLLVLLLVFNKPKPEQENTVVLPQKDTIIQTQESTPAEEMTQDSVKVDEPQKVAESQKVDEPQKVAESQKADESQQEGDSELTAQFKKEFWDLIHTQEGAMGVYGSLFRKYNYKVKGSEQAYLSLTILKNTREFNIWSENLRRIPSNEIQKVNRISQLKELLEKYEENEQ